MPKLNGSATLALVAATFIIAGITIMYLSAESGLYWSDYGYYQFILKKVSDTISENPLNGFVLIVYSTKLLYNFLFTIPLLPTSLVFGESRIAFIVAMVLIFQIPAAILLAALINRTLNMQNNKMFWIAFVLFMTQPALWACTLRGYPDAIAFNCLLLSFYFCQNAKTNPNLKNALLTAFFLALSPILRRHYAYGALAAAASFLVVFYQGKRDLRKTFVQTGKIVFLTFVFLTTVGFGFLMSLFTEPFLNLYQSACVSLPEATGYFISGFGLTTWLLAGTGIILAFKSDLFDREKLNSLVALSILLVADWCLFGRHLAIHYLMYAAPIVVLGCSNLVYILINNKRLMLTGVISAFLLGNFALGICEFEYEKLPFKLTRFGMLTMPLDKGNLISYLISANFGPIRRHDLVEMGLLLKELRSMDTSFQPIFIASGNQILCPDILRNYQRKYYLSKDFPKYIEPPILNSRDALPLGALLSCNSLVLAHPFVSMYKPEHSTILSCVLDCFDKHWPISKDFEKMSFSTKLEDDSKITIYKRIKATSISTAIKTLVEIKNSIKPDPIYGQPAWISSTKPYEPTGKEIQTTFDVTDGFLLSSNTFKNKTILEGSVDSLSKSTSSIGISLFDQDGNCLFESDTRPLENTFSFKLPQIDKEFFVAIKISSKGNKATLGNLQLK